MSTDKYSYYIQSNYRIYLNKCTVKQILSLQITACVLFKKYLLL